MLVLQFSSFSNHFALSIFYECLYGLGGTQENPWFPLDEEGPTSGQDLSAKGGISNQKEAPEYTVSENKGFLRRCLPELVGRGGCGSLGEQRRTLTEY